MPSASGTPLMWEVWDVNQSWSRSESNPKQPNDQIKQSRKYLVIADPLKRMIATCCPIQGKTFGHYPNLTEVSLVNGYGGFVTKDCLILCHEIYTFENKFFTNFNGTLHQTEIDKVSDALYEFLKI